MGGIFRKGGGSEPTGNEVTANSNIADDAVVRGDGGAKAVQGSSFSITDAGVLSGTEVSTTTGTFTNSTIGTATITTSNETTTTINSATITTENVTTSTIGTATITTSNETTANITTANITDLVLTNPLQEAYGGTNQTTYATGDMLYASAANTLSKLSPVTTTPGLPLLFGS